MNKTFVWDENFFNLARFEFENVTFSIAPGSTNKDIILIQNDQIMQKLNTYNVDFGNANLRIFKPVKMFGLSRGTYTNIYYKGRTAVVNSRWGSTAVTSDMAEFVPKYYLDVKVVDQYGNPVQGANVKAVNEVNDNSYPAENMPGVNWFYMDLWCNNSPNYCWGNYGAYGQHMQHPIAIYNYNDGHVTYAETANMPCWNIAATTDVNGHTPYPTAPTPSNSLVLPDYSQTQTGTTQFTYTIITNYSGKTATITGVNPDETWYRSNPNSPARTVKCNIDTGICALVGAETGSVSGTVKALGANNPIPNATVSGGGTSTQTNSTGGYLLANIATGAQQVTANKQGYVAQTKQVNVIKDSTVNLDFTLSVAIPPAIISFSPSNLTPSQDEGTTNTFNVSVEQPVTSKWFLDSIQQSSTSQSYAKIWSFSDAGAHNITYVGENANGTVSKTWIVTVNNVADTTPPVITNVGSSGIISSSATITWTTNEPATSQVEYGLDTSYGLSTILDSNLVTSHSTTLTGLINNTLYHYRVKSKDADNNLNASGDYNFTTLQTSADLIGWWKFDEGSGITAVDSSGKGNNGTVNRALWVDGKSGKALSFDGVNDYVEAPHNYNLSNLDAVTLGGWIKTTTSTDKIIISKHAGGTDGEYYLATLSSGSIRMIIVNEASSRVDCDKSFAYSDGNWHYIVGTYNGSSINIYADGSFLGSCSQSGKTKYRTDNVRIGTYMGLAWLFNGVIDEVEIYSRALTADEVKADYLKYAGTNVPSITSYSPSNLTPSQVEFGWFKEGNQAR